MRRTEDVRLGERWKEMVAQTALEMVGKLHDLDLDKEGAKAQAEKVLEEYLESSKRVQVSHPT